MATDAPPPPRNVRRALAELRARWERHSPVAPFSLADEIMPGLTVAAFCVDVMLTQRTRRAAATPATQSAATPSHDTLRPAEGTGVSGGEREGGECDEGEGPACLS